MVAFAGDTAAREKDRFADLVAAFDRDISYSAGIALYWVARYATDYEITALVREIRIQTVHCPLLERRTEENR